jgi:hypothetical protein
MRCSAPGHSRRQRERSDRVSLSRTRLFSRGYLIAWAISFALGLGWVLLLESLPSDFWPIVALFIALVGLFGFLLGLGIASGLLVEMLSITGSRPGAMSHPGGSVSPDRAFGIGVMLFSLPSLFVYLGG